MGSTLLFEFVTTRVFLGFGDIYPEQAGMFFLKSKTPLILTITDNHYPYLTAALTAPLLKETIMIELLLN